MNLAGRGEFIVKEAAHWKIIYSKRQILFLKRDYIIPSNISYQIGIDW